MDKPSNSAELPRASSLPVQLNSLDFPPLIIPSRPDAISGTFQNRSNMTKATGSKPLLNKRPMREDVEELSDNDSLFSSFNSDTTENASLSPVKKSRKMSYREPPPVLQSLDADAFKSLLESPTLSDSQNSVPGLGSLSWADSSATRTSSENLGSMSDIIQKYSTASLDSIRGFGMLETDYTQNSSTLISSASRSLFSETKVEVHSSNNYSNMNAPSNTSYTGSDNNMHPENLMSLTSDVRSVSQVIYSESSSINLQQCDNSDKPKSYERLLSSIEEDNNNNNNNTECSEQDGVKTKLKTSYASTKSLTGKSKSKYAAAANDNESSDDETNSSDHSSEADLNEYENCKKNPKHLQFHSPYSLQVKDLPAEIQNEDGVTFLNCLSQLVVQITVHSTSHARGLNDMYSKYIGTDRKRNGSGYIANVDEMIKYRCKRKDCPYAVHNEYPNSSFDDSTSITPPSLKRGTSTASSNSSISDPSNTSFNRSISNISNTSSTFNRSFSNMSTASSASGAGRELRHYFYSGVYVHTNKHVIFDKSEADNAYVKFFYNTPDGRGVIEGHVAAITGVNDFQDHVTLHVMSHEKTLFSSIDVCLKNARSSYNQMLQSTHRAHQALSKQHKHSWVAILSHPHGTAKTITFGRVMKETVENKRIIKYYDAATCPGSSGGLVITPSLLQFQWPGAVHSCTDNKTGYNVTFDSRIKDLDYEDMGRIHKTLFKNKKFNCGDTFKI